METCAPVTSTLFPTTLELANYGLELLAALPGGDKRSAELPLPPVWPADGIVSIISRSAQSITIKHRWLHEQVVLQNGAGSFHWSDDGEKLIVEKNWSDNRMSLSSPSCARKLLLNQVFKCYKAEQGVCSLFPPSRSDSLAIYDKRNAEPQYRKRRKTTSIAGSSSASCSSISFSTPPPLLAGHMRRRAGTDKKTTITNKDETTMTDKDETTITDQDEAKMTDIEYESQPEESPRGEVHTNSEVEDAATTPGSLEVEGAMMIDEASFVPPSQPQSWRQ